MTCLRTALASHAIGHLPRGPCTILLAVAIAPVLAMAAEATPAPSRQPSLVGTWEWTRKSNNCAEQHVYRADGTVSVQSGERRTENTYRIAWAPEQNGRYKLATTSVKDAGGRDCAGSIEPRPAGQQSVVYVLFGQSQTTMIQCQSLEGSDCIGPLKKAER